MEVSGLFKSALSENDITDNASTPDGTVVLLMTRQRRTGGGILSVYKEV